MNKFARSVGSLVGLGLLLSLHIYPTPTNAQNSTRSQKQSSLRWYDLFPRKRKKGIIPPIPNPGVSRTVNGTSELILVSFVHEEAENWTISERPTILAAILPKNTAQFQFVVEELKNSSPDQAKVRSVSKFTMSAAGGIVKLQIPFSLTKEVRYRWSIQELGGNEIQGAPLEIAGQIKRVVIEGNQKQLKEADYLAQKDVFYDSLYLLSQNPDIWKKEISNLLSKPIYENLKKQQKQSILNASLTNCCSLSPTSNK